MFKASTILLALAVIAIISAIGAAAIDIAAVNHIYRSHPEAHQIHPPQYDDMHDHPSDNYNLERELSVYGMCIGFPLLIFISLCTAGSLTLLIFAIIIQRSLLTSIWLWLTAVLSISFSCWFIPRVVSIFVKLA